MFYLKNPTTEKRKTRLTVVKDCDTALSLHKRHKRKVIRTVAGMDLAFGSIMIQTVGCIFLMYAAVFNHCIVPL